MLKPINSLTNKSTRALRRRLTEIQSTAFGMQMNSMDVPADFATEFAELEKELEKREADFQAQNKGDSNALTNKLSEDWLSVIARRSVSHLIESFALGHEQDGQEVSINPKSALFDDITVHSPSCSDQADRVTFFLRHKLTLAQLQTLYPDVAAAGEQKGDNKNTGRFEVLRLSDGQAGKLEFQLNPDDVLDRVIVFCL